MSRREFLSLPPKALAAALLTGAAGFGTGSGCSDNDGGNTGSSHPNLLLIMVDQLQTPPPGYDPDQEGVVQGLKEIFGFQALSPDNPYMGFFPGFLRLREHGVVLRTHYTAASACTPSRACIMTGQYNTGVYQTTGLFKEPDNVTWLDPDGIPTIGDWFRALGYETHYFGKWHVSDPKAPDYLEPWGFSDWEKSYPEPHGMDVYNLGVYRDVGFVEDVGAFLTGKGAMPGGKPWFAVGSLVNPHDCGSWPVKWQMPKDGGVVPWVDFPPPPPNPDKGDQSLPDPDPDPEREGLIVPLNPDDFPQNTCSLPSTFDENLTDKPRCQYDYSLKFGLALKGKLEFKELILPYPLPFQLQGEYASAWSLAYNQFYTYLHYQVDLRIRQILQSLDKNGLKENTIVVFLSDHGDMTGAHGGMIQKWHSAYEEITRVPMVISSPLVNPSKTQLREIVQPTSSIDLAPTLLGLAGFSEADVAAAKAGMKDHHQVENLVGANLAPYVKGEKTGSIPGPDGNPRPGVFYMSNDMVTELGFNSNEETLKEYHFFLGNVEHEREKGIPLASGPVRQPNNVRALCASDWKIVRYVDPNGAEPDEWELYYLTEDPVEATNIVDYRTGEVREDVTVPGWTQEQLQAKNAALKAELFRQEALLTHQAG
jgi:arylsulfatase A-like enzyme